MTETVYSKAAIDGIVGDLVETHSLMFGMIVGTNLKAGVWTEEEARFRLEEMMGHAKSVIAKAVIGGTLKQVETMSGPFLEVIDGGKTD